MGGRLATLPRAYLAVLVAVVATSGLAAAAKPVVVPAGNPMPYFKAELWPAKLSKTEPTPARFAVSTDFKDSSDTSHPPALKELFFKVDKNAGIDLREDPTVREIPGCVGRLFPPRSVGALRQACEEAVVGGGHMAVEVQFSDTPPIAVESKLTILNGGVKSGVATLYIHAFFTAPVASWIVTTAKIEKVREGRYGTEVAALVPKIAGGAGSITSLTLWLKRGVVSATCSDGRLSFHNESVFADGTRLTQAAIRTCTARETAR